MKTPGIYINEDGSATVVYPSEGSLSGLASRTFPRPCWVVTSEYFNGLAPDTKLKISRREALVDVATDSKIRYNVCNADFFKLVRLAIKKCSLDPDDDKTFKRMCGLAREMIEDGEI